MPNITTNHAITYIICWGRGGTKAQMKSPLKKSKAKGVNRKIYLYLFKITVGLLYAN